MEYGDHIVSDRLGYSHHGIYVGNGQVIHYAGFARGISKGKIEITDIDDFCQGQGCYIKNHILPFYDRDEVFERALSRVNEDSYNLLFNNCEHFVTWCIYGIRSSSQVNGVVRDAVAINILTSTYIRTMGLPYITAAGLPYIKGLPLSTAPFLFKASSSPFLASALGGGSTIAATSTSMLIGGSGAAMMSGTTASILGGAAAGAGVAAVGVGAGTAAAGVGIAGLAAVGGVALAPALGIMAAGAGLGYGAKKLFDWIWD